MSSPIIKVHLLNKSRSFRVLWLLEHLKLDYEIVPHKRGADMRAPEELRKLHPLGRSPLLELEDRQTGKRKILAESGYIFQYVLKHFDKTKSLDNEDIDKSEEIQYFLHYVEGSFQPPLLIELLLSMEQLTGHPSEKVTQSIAEKYSQGEVTNQLDFVEGQIKGNDGYLVGGKLSAADILLSFPVDMAFGSAFGHPFVDAEKYPAVKKWLQNLKALESYTIAKDKANANGDDV